MAADVIVTVAALMHAQPWQPIRNCPGRFALPASRQHPAELIGADVPVREFRSTLARDPVLVAVFADGGLITYRRDDGFYLHTVNTPDGFARKLAQLGIDIAVPGSAA